ncbi:hypothetical protein QYF36_021288 [Acer negundo]|nr:hypothetical protein QYF36_021288 [Acer negundo]
MATTTSLSPLFLNSSLFPPSTHKLHSSSSSDYQTRTKPICASITNFEVGVGMGVIRKEDIVIVGAGITGLATAVSLYRQIHFEPVELHLPFSRMGGEYWMQLELEVNSGPNSLKFKEDGRELRSFWFKDEDESQEVCAVERRILLETLANQLPPESVHFSSRLANIETTADGETILELTNGARLQSKIVIGCDGIRSPVAKWMGFSDPKYVSHCAYRGLGYYLDGHPFEPKVNYIYGRGLHAGYVPVCPTRVYWFICFNNPSPGPKITDPVLLKKHAKDLVRKWPAEILNIIDLTPDDTIIRTPLVDRWLWPAVSPPASTGRVVLVGDVWHPMTPNLGQGACCALEDAVVLARKLAYATKSGNASVLDALRSYESERWPRIFPLTIRANLVGSLLQLENPVVCSVRNNVVIPKLSDEQCFQSRSNSKENDINIGENSWPTNLYGYNLTAGTSKGHESSSHQNSYKLGIFHQAENPPPG